MDPHDSPATQPADALGPPHRRPPTALGTDSSEPPPPRVPRPTRHVRIERHVHIGPDLRAMIDAALDGLDRLADRIAGR